MRRALSKTGTELFPLLLEVRRGDIMAQSDYRRKEKLEWLDQLGKIYEEILRKKECVSIKDLAVSGRDLIQAGMKPGKEIGETLDRFLNIVLEEPEKIQKNICCLCFEFLLTPKFPAYNERDMKKRGRIMCMTVV